MLNNIKTVKGDRGFTIVELLIVIVVIAILAAITIVAYNGIQTRGNNVAAASTASNLAKKLEAYNSLYGYYPAVGASVTTALNATTNGTEPNITGSGITLVTSGTTPTGDNRKTNVYVLLCDTAAPAANATTKGFQVYRWNFDTGAWKTTADQSGGITTTCSTSASTGTQATWP